jgi:predicted metalloprotease with PDZ domain
MSSTLLAALLVTILGGAPADCDVSYTLERITSPELALGVEVRLRGRDSGTTELTLAPSWGGVTASGEDIASCEAHEANGAVLTIERPATWRFVVHHAPGASLVVRYRLGRNANQLGSTTSTYYRPIVNDHLFHVIGELALVQPQHLVGENRVHLGLAWRGFEDARWSMASSFGVGAGPFTVDETISDFCHALFVAGDIRIEQREIRGRPISIAIAGKDWKFRDAQFADLVATIVTQERAFFDDFDFPHYLVSAIPVGTAVPGTISLGGTGLTNCFALFLMPGLSLDPHARERDRIQSLLAHEMFHHWNGRVIARVEPEQLVYWFSEGFTNFYARRILYRSGFLDVKGYARSVNEALNEYFSSPVRREPNARIQADFWNDQSVEKLPYGRGDVVAMILDHAIRKASEGDRSLDDFMRELITEAREERARVSTESLLAKIAEFTDTATAELVRRIVVEGELATLDQDTFAPCLELRAPLAAPGADAIPQVSPRDGASAEDCSHL